MQQGSLAIAGIDITTYYLNTVVLGAGAAGMSCTLQLWDFYTQMGFEDAADRVACVTTGLPLGASRMSGSDKQTYYKMGTSPRIPDTALDFAKTLVGGGCMHGDHALLEGVSSLRQFYRLVDAGVPFPHDPEGAFIGYKTDHDPFERATSAGPKTSKFMSECLEARVRRAGVQIFDQYELVELIKDDAGRIVALLTIDKQRVDQENMGLTLFVAENVVLATGGPGQLYAVSVYPLGQVGVHGIALKAGLKANNMTESQYGLASIKFRWNVSGTYMQVVPRIYSTAADGVSDEREFLTDYFPTMERMATCIFLKGYQWPFDAQRVNDHQSSLVDMAVHREIFERGRRVYMDFLRNPVAGEGMNSFAIDRLEDEALVYLQRTGAMQERPIDRLAHMNQPAIDIYTEHDIDLWSEPLEIAVCAQHMNGGFCVDAWWESNLKHTFVIGEMAGTHGVKRPGGSALNAGQAGALRAAEYIANVYGPEIADAGRFDAAANAQAAATVDRLRSWTGSDGLAPSAVMEQLTTRMSRHAAHIRDTRTIAGAVAEAAAQYRELVDKGVAVATRSELVAAVQAESQCLTHLGMLCALRDLIGQGLGSRGSYVVLDPDGVAMPNELASDAGDVPHWRPENEALRDTIQELFYDPEAMELFTTAQVPCRPIPERDVAFEPMWTAFRDKSIYHS